MSDLTSTTHTDLYVNENGGAFEICNAPIGGDVLALCDDRGHAVVFAASYEMLDALLEVQEIAEEMFDADHRERIMSALSTAFGKIFQEAS